MEGRRASLAGKERTTTYPGKKDIFGESVGCLDNLCESVLDLVFVKLFPELLEALSYKLSNSIAASIVGPRR